MSDFEKLYHVDVNERTEKKNGLTYLSWAWAWAEFVKVHSDATYKIVKFDGKPYHADFSGAMVYTEVTANGITHEMWLPVMDGANKAMKTEPYTYKTKSGEKTVEAFTMFDINKTIMRCLTKNLAMFGLGLYIYAGEDLPEAEPPKPLTDEDFKVFQSTEFYGFESLKNTFGVLWVRATNKDEQARLKAIYTTKKSEFEQGATA